MINIKVFYSKNTILRFSYNFLLKSLYGYMIQIYVLMNV